MESLIKSLKDRQTSLDSDITDLLGDQTIYQFGRWTSSGSYSTSSTSYVQVSDSVTVTPERDDTELWFTIFVRARGQVTSSGGNLGGRLRLHFLNSGGTWSHIGPDFIRAVEALNHRGTTLITAGNNTLQYKLTQAQQNSSGDWQIRLHGAAVYTNNNLFMDEFEGLYYEVKS